MILSAGLGTRLRPLTDELPKPLCPVGDRPALAHVVDQLRLGGVGRVVVNVHHKAASFDAGTLAALALPITISREEEILGTAGGVREAERLLDPGDLVVWNGDIVATLDVRALLDAHAARSALATLVVVRRAVGEGTVGLGRDGRVVRLRGERFGEETTGADFVGAQTIGARFRSTLPARGCLVGDGYLPALRAGEVLHTFAIDGPFADIGAPPSYLAANLAWLAQTGASSFVGDGAVVGSHVRLVDAVVGAGAHIDGEGELRRCVVWPGARARAPLTDTIVSRRAQVGAAGG